MFHRVPGITGFTAEIRGTMSRPCDPWRMQNRKAEAFVYLDTSRVGVCADAAGRQRLTWEMPADMAGGYDPLWEHMRTLLPAGTRLQHFDEMRIKMTERSVLQLQLQDLDDLPVGMRYTCVVTATGIMQCGDTCHVCWHAENLRLSESVIDVILRDAPTWLAKRLAEWLPATATAADEASVMEWAWRVMSEDERADWVQFAAVPVWLETSLRVHYGGVLPAWLYST